MDWGTRLTSLSEHDYAGQWIDALFNSVPLQAGFAVYNAVLLLLASGLLGWNILAAIVASAHDGVPLGKRWNSFWIPIRLVLAVGLLAPVGPSHMGAGQWAIYSLARGASAMANEVWSAISGSVLVDGFAASVPSRVGGGLVRDVALAEICQAARQAVDSVAGREPPKPPAVRGVETPRGIAWRYAAACGTIRLPSIEDEPEFAAARRDAAAHVVGEIRGFMSEAVEAVMPGGNTSLDPSPEKARLLANWLHGLARGYEQTVGKAAAEAAARKQVDERERLSEYMDQHGWTTAGMAFRPIAEASSLAANLASARHEKIEHSESLLATRDVQRAVETVAAYVKLGEREVELRDGDITAAGDANSNVLGTLTAPLRDALVWAGTGDGQDTDPVGWLLRWGHGLAISGEAVLAGGVIAGVMAKNAVSDAGGGDGAFDWAAPTARMVAYAAIAGGMVLSFVCPLLPYVFMVFAGVSFITKTAEGLLAIPAWCVALATMDGDDLLSRRAIPGVHLMVGLGLAPTLAILGLGASYVIVPEILRFLDETLVIAAIGGQAGAISGLLVILATTAASVYVAWEVVKRCYGLITSMPTRIMAWFGVNDPSHGEEQHGTAVIAGLGQGAQRSASAVQRAGVSRHPKGNGPAGNPDGGRAPRGNVSGARAPRS